MPNKDMPRGDKIYEYILIDKLQPYLEPVRKWWKEFENKTFTHTATFPVKDGPPGLFEKCARSPRQSAIYGVQAFPIIAVSYLNLPSMAGGAMNAVDEICKMGIEVEEFTVISKKGLPSTLMNGLFLCMIPTQVLNDRPIARWVYLRPNEILELANGIVTNTLAERVLPFAKAYKGDVL